MNSTVSQALKVARFDLGTSIRTKKAFIGIVLYVGLTLLVAAIGTFLQNKLMAEPSAANALGGAKDQIQQAVTAVLKNDALLAAHLVNQPVILMAFFWLTQTFMPLLIAIISSDVLNLEIKTGSARFVLLRTSRSSLVLGKSLSHGLIFLIAAFLSWATFLIYVTVNLKGFSLSSAMPFVITDIGCTLMMGFCYLGLTALVSSLVDTTVATILVLLVVLIALSGVANSEAVGWISPAWYRYKLWSPRPDELLAGLAAYFVFGTLFFAGAWQRFLRRDV